MSPLISGEATISDILFHHIKRHGGSNLILDLYQRRLVTENGKKGVIA